MIIITIHSITTVATLLHAIVLLHISSDCLSVCKGEMECFYGCVCSFGVSNSVKLYYSVN